MLYIYEKFQQIRTLREDVFIEKWKVRFSEDKLKNYPKQNLYCFNKEKDEDIVAFLTVIYPLDTNYVSKLHTLKNNRDIASHVCDIGLEFKEKQVHSYLEELLLVIGKLEKLHFDNYLKELSPSSLLTAKPSSMEKRYLLDRLIVSLKRSSTFNEAQEIENNILAFKDSIIPSHIEQILEAIFQEGFPAPINQVLEASGGVATANFLKQIFNLDSNKQVDINKWHSFCNNLENQEYWNIEKVEIIKLYNWLYQKVGRNTEGTNLDNIPF